MTTIETKRRAYLEIRSQKAVGSWPKQGPDKYVAVQIVPDGVKPLQALNQSVAKKRGITIEYFGEGYSRNDGPASSLGKAIAAAKERVRKINGQ